MLEHCAFASRVHIGRKRETNEDEAVIEPTLGVLGVFDGMGGLRAGEVAAAKAKAGIIEHVKANEQTPAPEATLRQGIETVNKLIVAAGKRSPGRRGMGTTATVGWIKDKQLHIAHLGDSRAYLMRGANLQLLTYDHTVGLELMRQGAISQEEFELHAYRNVLARHLGQSGVAKPDLCTIDLERGDRILFCTDGVHGMVPAEVLARTLRLNGTMDELADELVETALRYGGRDNIGLALVEVGGRVNPRTTVVIKTSGTKHWESRRGVFQQTLQKHNIAAKLKHIGLDESANARFFAVVAADLRRGSAFQMWRFAHECAQTWAASGEPFEMLREILELWRHGCHELLLDLEQSEPAIAALLESAIIQILVAQEGGVATLIAEQIRECELKQLRKLDTQNREPKRSTLRMHSIPPAGEETIDWQADIADVVSDALTYARGHENIRQRELMALLAANIANPTAITEPIREWLSSLAPANRTATTLFAHVDTSRVSFIHAIDARISGHAQVQWFIQTHEVHARCCMLIAEFFAMRFRDAADSIKQTRATTQELHAEFKRRERDRLSKEFNRTSIGFGPVGSKK